MLVQKHTFQVWLKHNTNIVIFYNYFHSLPEDIECFTHGECTQSLFVGQWPAVDAQDCLEICQDHAGCQFFTHYGQDDACLGLANCVELDDKSCLECYSGNRTCPGKYYGKCTN